MKEIKDLTLAELDEQIRITDEEIQAAKDLMILRDSIGKPTTKIKSLLITRKILGKWTSLN